MASQRKPVIVRKFSRDWCAGYAMESFGSDRSELEILDTHGRIVRVGWEQIKWVCFVRDLTTATGNDPAQPEKFLRKRFTTRPRTAGLWLRVVLTDGESLEGLAANDRSLVDSVGLMLTPPDTRSNTQRIFIPRTSIESLEVVGLIGASSHRSRSRTEQPDLFPAGDPEQSAKPRSR